MPGYLLRLLAVLVLGIYIGWLFATYQYSPFLQSDKTHNHVPTTQTKGDTDFTCPAPQPVVLETCNVTGIPSSEPVVSASPENEITSVDKTSSNFLPDQRFSQDEPAYWQQQILYSRDETSKFAAIEELVQRERADLLASGLGDKSREIRIATIEGLSRIGDSHSVRILASVLFSNANPTDKLRAIEALSELRHDPHAELFLEASLQQEKNTLLREATYNALGRS